MGNVFPKKGIPYAQFPRCIEELLPKMEGNDAKVYFYLLCEGHTRTRVDLEITRDTIADATGLALNTVSASIENLSGLGCVRKQRGQHRGFCYVLCDPATGQPLPDPRLSYENQAITTPTGRQRPTRFDLYNLSREQYEKAYAAFLPGAAFKSNGSESLLTNCPFHSDRKPSLSIHLTDGGWVCKGGCGKGSIFKFVMLQNKCDAKRAFRIICAALELGRAMFPRNAFRLGEEEAVYNYRDEDFNLICRKSRYPGKEFLWSRLSESGNWIHDIEKIRVPLYNLPQVLAASLVIICEGEKDCDRVSNLGLRAANGSLVAVTCNPSGAGPGKWVADFSRCMKGMRVIVLSDNDTEGMEHALAVKDSVSRYATVENVWLYSLSDPDTEGFDVSDYLDTHSTQELMDRMGNGLFQQTEQTVEQSLSV